jgi:tetratricopeptide (TPR) repeat protein
MNPVVKIGGAFYQINFPEKTIAAVSASEINLATAEAFFTSYHLERAAYFQKNHLPAEATRELNLIASIDPKGEYTNLALGLFNLSLLDNHIQAKDYFLKVIQVNPKNTIALVGMGLIHAHFKEVEKAKEYFDQAIDSNPQYALPYYLLYDLSLKTNDQEQAQKCLRALVAINPLDILAISLVAGDYLQNKSYQELQSFLDDAELGFDFNHFLIDYYRGIAYFETQQPQKAKQSLEISFQETSGMVFETSLLLGQIARQRNDLSQAAYHFNLVSAVKPDFCPAYLELAQIYKNQGEQSKAREMEKQAELCGKQ